MSELMQRYQQACREVIEKYDGHVAQYLGDGLMVYFGWPRAHEDDAERAVRAGLDLVEAVSLLSAPASPSKSAAQGVLTLRVRIGIATGPVVVGETGEGDASIQGRRLPPAVVEHILSRTDGVPLFVEELTKAIIESGLLTRSGEDYALAGALSSLPIPSTLQDSLMARLDRLTKGKALAQVGACIGREFTHELLAAVTQLSEPELGAAVQELTDAGLIHAQGSAPRASYLFKHALVRDAAYASLLHSKRQVLHETIAATLERVFPETKAAEPGVLAQHLSEAGKHQQALPYWEAAAQQALKGFAVAETLQHLSSALACLSHWPDDTDTRLRQISIVGQSCFVRMMSEGFGAPGQLEAFERLRQLSDELRDCKGVSFPRFALWWFRLLCADYRDCTDVIVQLAVVPEEDAGDEIARKTLETVCRLCTIYFLGRFQDAWKVSRTLRSLVDQFPRPTKISEEDWLYHGMQSWDFGSWILLLEGRPESARRERNEGWALVKEKGSPFARVSLLTHWLCEYVLTKDPQPAEALARDVIAQSEEHGLLFRKGEGQMLLGWIQTELGQTDDGLRTLQAGYDLFRTIGFRIATSMWSMLFVYAYQRADRMDHASDALRQALEFCSETGETFLLAELRRLEGELTLARFPDQFAVAERQFIGAMDVAREQGARLFELRAACSLARLWQHQGKRRDALTMLQPLYDGFSEGFDTRDLKEARSVLAQLRS